MSNRVLLELRDRRNLEQPQKHSGLKRFSGKHKSAQLHRLQMDFPGLFTLSLSFNLPSLWMKNWQVPIGLYSELRVRGCFQNIVAPKTREPKVPEHTLWKKVPEFPKPGGWGWLFLPHCRYHPIKTREIFTVCATQSLDMGDKFEARTPRGGDHPML